MLIKRINIIYKYFKGFYIFSWELFIYQSNLSNSYNSQSSKFPFGKYLLTINGILFSFNSY